ncbi:hypothetical protein OH76DRAFT_668812 [Lentinus brumalis]|uniref:Uncharacterized protein n=1 Tax=Lentinus brumalis TaxID=2498619 RepID=A0A371D733_9APHY|nr:hypothetical protein OH76DRAFT_668812 [Polyporus brumalis]
MSPGPQFPAPPPTYPMHIPFPCPHCRHFTYIQLSCRWLALCPYSRAYTVSSLYYCYRLSLSSASTQSCNNSLRPEEYEEQSNVWYRLLLAYGAGLLRLSLRLSESGTVDAGNRPPSGGSHPIVRGAHGPLLSDNAAPPPVSPRLRMSTHRRVRSASWTRLASGVLPCRRPPRGCCSTLF